MVTVRIKLNQYLSEWVISRAGHNAPYRTHNDYVEDLIRRDKALFDSVPEPLTGSQRLMLNSSTHQGVKSYLACKEMILKSHPHLVGALAEIDGDLMQVAIESD